MKKPTFPFVVVVLLLAAVQVVIVGAQQEEEFQCKGICGNNGEGMDVLNNPDTVVTYSWNDNVPVGSSTVGQTEQTMTCRQFDSTLYSFSNDESQCEEHQTGLQTTAGCACGDGSGSSGRRGGGGGGRTVFSLVSTGGSIMAIMASAVFI